jgi:hypothetical protein
MSRLIRSIGLCAFISLTALPAIADQTTAPPAQPVTPATSAVVPVDHQSYTRRAESDVEEWKTKLDSFMQRARATGNATATATDAKLQEAWAKVKAATRGLETAGNDTWEGARHAYEATSNDLASAWNSAQQSL